MCHTNMKNKSCKIHWDGSLKVRFFFLALFLKQTFWERYFLLVDLYLNCFGKGIMQRLVSSDKWSNLTEAGLFF